MVLPGIIGTFFLAFLAYAIIYQGINTFRGGANRKEALDKTREYNEKGIHIILSFACEHAKSKEAALKNYNEFRQLTEDIAEQNLNASIAFKFSALGMSTLPFKEVKNITDALMGIVSKFNVQAWADRESKNFLPETRELESHLVTNFPHHINLVRQVRIKDTQFDLIKDRTATRVDHKRPTYKIRLCKGAYIKEGPIPLNDLRKEFVSMGQRYIAAGIPLVLATHDDNILSFFGDKYPKNPPFEIHQLCGLDTPDAQAIYMPYGPIKLNTSIPYLKRRKDEYGWLGLLKILWQARTKRRQAQS